MGWEKYERVVNLGRAERVGFVSIRRYKRRTTAFICHQDKQTIFGDLKRVQLYYDRDLRRIAINPCRDADRSAMCVTSTSTGASICIAGFTRRFGISLPQHSLVPVHKGEDGMWFVQLPSEATEAVA